MFGVNPWVLLAVGLAFAGVASWGGYQAIRAEAAIGDKRVAENEKATAEAEKAVAESDRNRAVDANKQLQAANQELQEARERERKILAQVVSQLDEINANVEGQSRAVNDLKETNADIAAYLSANAPDDVKRLLDR